MARQRGKRNSQNNQPSHAHKGKEVDNEFSVHAFAVEYAIN